MNDVKQVLQITERVLHRRAFVRGAGLAGLGAAAVGLTGCGSTSMMAQSSSVDTVQQIFTAALIAESVGITFYYNGLTAQAIITDTALAGPGGTATNVSESGELDNVGYLRAALSEEIQHSNLLRTLTGGTTASGDPIQQFYFPTGTFQNMTTFISTLDALESAFIGAYMTAVQELALMLGNVSPYSSTQMDNTGKAYTPAQLANFAKVAASILGVESEHRALGRSIGGSDFASTIPANNLNYESTDGLTTVYNGAGSAVTALTPFVQAGANGFDPTAFSYAAAITGAPSLILPTTGTPPM
jgi:Ferritin-like domain